jgi:hypothetical protein
MTMRIRYGIHFGGLYSGHPLVPVCAPYAAQTNPEKSKQNKNNTYL